MKKSSRTSRDTFRVSAVTVGCLALLVAAGGVQAQQLETVVVTGIRKGIEDAISVKKNKDNIVEAISAEDIGKLPDSSIAESIARLPGVTAQRVAGRASNISIRGMSGDFSTALLNGREQVSTGDNRGVEFDQYPSELLGGVVVYKTPDGELVGQGLSGTIDLQTVRPLNFGKRVLAANLRKEKSGVGTEFEGSGKRFNFSYIDQFADRTIGVAFGFARLQSDVTTGRTETYNNERTDAKFDRATGKLWPSWDGSKPGEGMTYTGGFKYFNDSTDQTRDGAMAVLEYKPAKDFHTVVDMYYSKFDRETVKRGLEIQPEDVWRDVSSPKYPTLLNPVITNGRLISGTWTNVNPLARTIWEPRQDELRSIGWNTKVGDTKGWQFISDISYSNAKRDERIIEMEAGIPTPGTVTVSNYNQVTGLSQNYGDVNAVKLMDPEGWGQNGYDKTILTNDTIRAARFSAGTDLEGFFSRVSLGVNQTNRTKTKNATEYFLRFPDGADKTRDLPAGTSSVSVGGSNGAFNTIAFDPSTVYNGNYYRKDPNVYADVLLKGWEISEKVTTVFSKANIDSEFMGLPLRGNLGLQWVKTNQDAIAPDVDLSTGASRLIKLGKDYNDVLPSVNLSLDLGDDQIVRLGAAKVLARARMDQMSAGRRGEVGNDNKWTGSGGNPYLDPFRATALDVSYEKYWGNKAYVSVAAFNKNLESYIFDFTDTSFDFSSFRNGSTRVPTSTIGRFTQPRNGKGGYVRGVELAVSLPFDKLMPELAGFGAVASYADTKSEIKPFGDADTRPLPGLSRKVANLTFYYEAHGFQARVSNRYRSDFLGEVQGFGANREYTYIKAESIVDAQVGYEFQSGPAKGLSILLQVNNLNNEAFQRYNGSNGQIIDTIKYGKTYLLGATYKL